MSNPQVTNLFKSNAVIYLAPVGEALPDETAVAAGAAWGGNWARIGFTKEPTTFAYETETTDFNVEEHLGPLERRKIGHTLRVETSLAEFAGEYLNLTINSDEGEVTVTPPGVGQVGFEAFELGLDTAKMQKFALGIEGVLCDANGNDLPARQIIFKGQPMLNGELKYSQRDDDYTGTPFAFHALADPDNAGNFGAGYRVTAPATP